MAGTTIPKLVATARRGAIAAALAIAACGAPHASPPAALAHAAKATSLFPEHRADCTKEGWCRFAEQPPIYIDAVHVANGALYAAGYQGDLGEDGDSAVIARWDGTSWKVWHLSGVVLLSIDGDGDHLWASGRRAPTVHLVGDEWVADEGGPVPDKASLVAVTGNDVFVGAGGGLRRRGPHADWSDVNGFPGGQWDIYSLAGDREGRLWTIASELNDKTAPSVFVLEPGASQLAAVEVAHDLYSVAVYAPTDVAVVGNSGLFRWDGHAWQRRPHGDYGHVALVDRGRDVAILGELDDHHSGVEIVDATGSHVQPLIGQFISTLAAGPDGSLWASGGDPNYLWFHPP